MAQSAKAAFCHDNLRFYHKQTRTKLARPTDNAMNRATTVVHHKKDTSKGVLFVVGRGGKLLQSNKASLATNYVEKNERCCFCSFARTTAYTVFKRCPVHHKKAPLLRCFFVVGRGGFEPPKSKTSDLQSDPFGRSGICPYMDVALFVVEPVIGLEPTTC